MRSLKNIFNEEPVTISDEDFFRLAPVWTVKTELNYLTGAILYRLNGERFIGRTSVYVRENTDGDLILSMGTHKSIIDKNQLKQLKKIFRTGRVSKKEKEGDYIEY